MDIANSKTQRLYYEDSHMVSFTARVLSCQPSPKVKDCWEVVLDRTAFYPEGGGQLADHGILGGVPVADVRERDGEVCHITSAPLEEDREVEGNVDWPRRLLLMQQHTGEHILSGIVHKLYGYENVGFHMGADGVTVDFDGEIAPADLPKLERLANQAIWADLPVTADWPPEEERSQMSYRSKKELTWPVRLVTVEDTDVCACCGVHTRRTGEVGALKIVSCQKHKGGVRLTLQIGSSALEHYGQLLDSVTKISNLLSAKQPEVAQAVERLQEETISLRQGLSAARRELFEAKAEALPEGRETLCMVEGPGLTPVELRQYCARLCEKAKAAAIFSGDDSQGYKYAFGSLSADSRPYGRQLNEALRGRGGGAADCVQGSVSASGEQIRDFFARLVL